MEQTFKLIIRTPQETIFEGETEMIHLATEGGEIEVFANHASLTGSITFSPVNIRSDKEESYLVRNGVFLFDNETNSASLLVLHCEHKAEVSHQTIKEYAAFIDEQLKAGKDLSDFQILYLKGEKVAVEEQIQELQ